MMIRPKYRACFAFMLSLPFSEKLFSQILRNLKKRSSLLSIPYRNRGCQMKKRIRYRSGDENSLMVYGEGELLPVRRGEALSLPRAG